VRRVGKGWSAAASLVLLSSIAGCRNSDADHATPASSVAAVTDTTDRWLGRWNGPEGTFLQVSRTGDRYLLEIRNLDDSKTFDGFAAGNRIRFVRDGATEYISAGDGRSTGMKWLLDKKDCLLTKPGEGWCRD
jgi:hypothetical protein